VSPAGWYVRAPDAWLQKPFLKDELAALLPSVPTKPS
jgi:hypothetical protein